jgi:hypothetical protein
VTHPSEAELKELIRSPKPAFFARGVATDPERGPTFTAIHDGRGGWFVERPGLLEFKAAERTILVGEDVKVIDSPVAANNDVKGSLEGKRITYLAEGRLELIGSTVVACRSCFDIRAWGLKRGDERPFEMAVDRETGCILRLSNDGIVLIEVTEFRVGVPTTS